MLRRAPFSTKAIRKEYVHVFLLTVSMKNEASDVVNEVSERTLTNSV